MCNKENVLIQFARGKKRRVSPISRLYISSVLAKTVPVLARTAPVSGRNVPF